MVMPQRPCAEANVMVVAAQAAKHAARMSGSRQRGYLASSSRDALARARPVGEPGMARAIGQALDRGVAAKTEILGARSADRPAASLLAQLEQRAAVSVVDRL